MDTFTKTVLPDPSRPYPPASRGGQRRGLESPVGGGLRLGVVDDDGSLRLTIGQLASRTGLAVRTIRYWSDIGAVPPAGRTSGGHRLYDAESVARLELVATLRELGLGLDEVARVLAREATVADVAAAHVAALDARIRSLRLTRAVLSTVARRDPGTEEMTLMNKLARLSAAGRTGLPGGGAGGGPAARRGGHDQARLCPGAAGGRR